GGAILTASDDPSRPWLVNLDKCPKCVIPRPWYPMTLAKGKGGQVTINGLTWGMNPEGLFSNDGATLTYKGRRDVFAVCPSYSGTPALTVSEGTFPITCKPGTVTLELVA